MKTLALLFVLSVPLFAQTVTSETPSAEVPADNDDLKQQIQALTDSANELRKRAESAERDAARARSRLRELQDDLERTRTTNLPSQINLGERFITDRSATFSVKMDRPGRLLAELKEVGGPTFEKRSDEIAKSHIFAFDNLAANRPHELKLTVLDWNGSRSNAVMQGGDLNFATAALNQGPVLSFDASPVETTSTSVKFAFNLTEPAFVKFECRQRIPGTTATTRCARGFIGEAELSPIGEPLGTTYRLGRNEISASGLDPDREFEFVPVGHDVLALKLTEASASRPLYKTSQKLDFSGPVRMEIQPGGMKFQWKATTQPAKGIVRLKIGTTTLVDTEAPYDSVSGSNQTVVPTSALVAAVMRDPKNAVPPVIEVRMEGDGTALTREFVIGVAVPPANTPGLTSDQREAIVALTSSIDQPDRRKIKWAELVKLGVPLILSFL